MMINKSGDHFLLFIGAIIFIQCNASKEIIKASNDIVGVYTNKVKAGHLKENLELLKDSSFLLTTQYEWNRYEYKGLWKLKADTLILKCDSSLSFVNEKYFKEKWLLKGKPMELILLSNQNYSLQKNN
jgi:hypothetical protein